MPLNPNHPSVPFTLCTAYSPSLYYKCLFAAMQYAVSEHTSLLLPISTLQST